VPELQHTESVVGWHAQDPASPSAGELATSDRYCVSDERLMAALDAQRISQAWHGSPTPTATQSESTVHVCV
jgi:hypothetical protein